MAQLVKDKEIREIIIAIPRLSKNVFEETIGLCKGLDISCSKMQDILPR
jgi:FlaA1/EpsC-like NDP-sugar epimerase